MGVGVHAVGKRAWLPIFDALTLVSAVDQPATFQRALHVSRLQALFGRCGPVSTPRSTESRAARRPGLSVACRPRTASSSTVTVTGQRVDRGSFEDDVAAGRSETPSQREAPSGCSTMHSGTRLHGQHCIHHVMYDVSRRWRAPMSATASHTAKADSPRLRRQRRKGKEKGKKKGWRFWRQERADDTPAMRVEMSIAWGEDRDESRDPSNRCPALAC